MGSCSATCVDYMVVFLGEEGRGDGDGTLDYSQEFGGEVFGG